MLVGRKTFNKLDLSYTYQKIVFKETSHRYVVMNIHHRLFRYNRLPFGVSSAPGIFQHVMDSLMGGLKGVYTYLDHKIVTAPMMSNTLRLG